MNRQQEPIDHLFKLTCSTLFLLHPLGLSRDTLSGTGFINAFLIDPNRPQYEGMDMVFLVFKPSTNGKFKYLIDTERVRTPLFIDEYDLEGGLVVMAYEFPADLVEDLEKFKKGQYSKFSREFQKTVPKFKKVKGFKEEQLSFQYMVINKEPQWSELIGEALGLSMNYDDDQEFWEKPRIEKETINLDKLLHKI